MSLPPSLSPSLSLSLPISLPLCQEPPQPFPTATVSIAYQRRECFRGAYQIMCLCSCSSWLIAKWCIARRLCSASWVCAAAAESGRFIPSHALALRHELSRASHGVQGPGARPRVGWCTAAMEPAAGELRSGSKSKMFANLKCADPQKPTSFLQSAARISHAESLAASVLDMKNFESNKLLHTSKGGS